MFILRMANYPGGVSTGKPDGMMIRESDSWWTSVIAQAKLFETVELAEQHWMQISETRAGGKFPVFVVAVETRPIVAKVSKSITKTLT